jgi:hypothetical protein
MKQESIGFEINRHLSARAPSSDELDAAYTPLLSLYFGASHKCMRTTR